VPTRLTFALALVLAVAVTLPVSAQNTAAPSDLATNIGRLASLDYATRMNAARAIRRVPQAQAVPALTQAARSHEDEFVRYRAFVLLTAFNDRSTPELVRWAIGDKNDRLRENAYKWLERNPDPQMVSSLMDALRTEQAEFVRPALVGALAALGKDPQVQKALIGEVSRGLDFFRSAVIDSLGRHKATYAIDALATVTTQDGPLQDDAVLALGRIGDRRGVAAVAAVNSRSPDVILAVRVARCLLGDDCPTHLKALTDAAGAPGASSAVVRAATDALSVLADSGHPEALDALLGLAARGGSVREHAAVGVAAAAVRRPDAAIAWLNGLKGPSGETAVDMLKDGFDILEEDYAEEQFFATARATYWKVPEGSSTRTLAATLIQKLEF
jgi:HEAT repeat protein